MTTLVPIPPSEAPPPLTWWQLLLDILLHPVKHWRHWSQNHHVRIEWRDHFYVRLTPHFGFSIPWFSEHAKRKKGKLRGTKLSDRRRRLRFSRYHRLQIVEWQSSRWVVVKQVLGTSRVQGEVFTSTALKRKKP